MKITEMEPCNQSSIMATSSIQHTMSATTNYLISAHLSAQQLYCQPESNQGQGTVRAILPLTTETTETSSYSTTGYKNILIEV